MVPMNEMSCAQAERGILYTVGAAPMRSLAMAVPILFMAAKETIGYCLAVISTLGVAGTKSMAGRETISLAET
jgi:hypothetical protein